MTAAIGALRNRVTLQTKVRTDDGGGGASIVWLDVQPVWASVEPATAGQQFRAEQLGTRITHDVAIRWRPDVRPGMRILLGDQPGSGAARYLAIRGAVDERERHSWLRLSCEEVTESDA